MLKYGYISDIAPDTGLFRVKFDENDIVSPWMPAIVRKSLKDNGSEWYPFDTNEHVCCLMEQGWDNGVILGAIYSDEDKPKDATKDLVYVEYKDGTRQSYDRSSKELKEILKGKWTVTADDDINLKSSKKAIFEGDTVFLGSETDAIHPVAYADVLIDKLKEITAQLKATGDAGSGITVTTMLGPMPTLNIPAWVAIKVQITEVETELDAIKSGKVKTK